MLIYKHLLEFFTSNFFQDSANEVVIYNLLALLTIDTNINQFTKVYHNFNKLQQNFIKKLREVTNSSEKSIGLTSDTYKF